MDQIILFTILSIAFFSLCITALVILKKQREEEILNLENFKSDFKESNLLFLIKIVKKIVKKIETSLVEKSLSLARMEVTLLSLTKYRQMK